MVGDDYMLGSGIRGLLLSEHFPVPILRVLRGRGRPRNLD